MFDILNGSSIKNVTIYRELPEYKLNWILFKTDYNKWMINNTVHERNFECKYSEFMISIGKTQGKKNDLTFVCIVLWNITQAAGQRLQQWVSLSGTVETGSVKIKGKKHIITDIHTLSHMFSLSLCLKHTHAHGHTRARTHTHSVKGHHLFFDMFTNSG